MHDVGSVGHDDASLDIALGHTAGAGVAAVDALYGGCADVVWDIVGGGDTCIYLALRLSMASWTCSLLAFSSCYLTFWTFVLIGPQRSILRTSPPTWTSLYSDMM